jgi:hypothetical protein
VGTYCLCTRRIDLFDRFRVCVASGRKGSQFSSRTRTSREGGIPDSEEGFEWFMYCSQQDPGICRDQAFTE